MAKSGGRVQAMLVAGLAVVLASCGSSSHLSGLDISPISPTIKVGSRKQFTVAAHYDNGSDQNVTSSVTWTSANTRVATICKALRQEFRQVRLISTQVSRRGQVQFKRRRI